MITDLDETIKKILVEKGKLDSGEVDISFEAPDREWSASISKPTINLYLYDIRENHELRGHEWSIRKDENGIATRKKNPNRIDLSYLITVWTNDIVDEHRLLWHVMLTLFRYSELPQDMLYGQLAEQTRPIRTFIAQPDGLLNNPADLWTALDNELKAAIDYVVTLPLDTDVEFTAPMVRTKIIKFKPSDADFEQLVQVSGMVHEAGKPAQGIAGVRVVAKESRMTAETDDQGRYSFKNLNEGKHTFEILVSGKKVGEASVTVPSASYDIEVK
jgi:hypothetical protein